MRKGNTYELTKEIVTRLLAKPGVECTEISVADLELPFCISCHACLNKGEEFCPHYEIVRSVSTALLECDGVIVSGATYVRALNGAMKNLIDHLAYYYHRPVLFGKKGMVIATSSGVGEKSVAKYLRTTLGQWGINDAMVVTLNEKEKRLKTKGDTWLSRNTEEYYRLIASKKPLSPSLKSIATHNSFRAMSLSEFCESERDALFWQQTGYSDKAYPVSAGPYKYAVGAIINKLVKISAKMVGRVYAKRKDR